MTSHSVIYGLANVQCVAAVPHVKGASASPSKEQFWIATNSASTAHPKPELHRIEVVIGAPSTSTTTNATTASSSVARPSSNTAPTSTTTTTSTSSTSTNTNTTNNANHNLNVTCKQMLASPSVVHIAPSPVDANAILLVSHKSSFLYRVADESPDAQLEVRAEIAHGDGVVTRQFAWHAATTDSHPSVAQLCATHLLIRDSSRLAETPLYTRHLRDAGLTSEAAWNPHKLNELALTAGKAVVGVDTRLSGDAAAAWTVPEADLVQALSVDFNPTAVHYMACGGVDGIVRIFDLRRTAEPALRLKNHQHWVTALRYSIFNDQMLLTAGADNSLKVYSIWSTSAAKQAAQRQAGGADDEQTQRQTAEAASRAKDKLALDITEHEDAVRTVAWAAGNKRLFASGSYTGRVVLTLMQ